MFPMSTNISTDSNLPPLLLTFTPEMQLILCCARAEMAEPFQVLIDRLIADGIEWELVLPLAARHGMMALLHKHLHRHLIVSEQSNISAEFMTHLHEQHKRMQVHQLFLTAQTLKINKLLRGNNIPHLNYKGIVLDHLLYGGERLRPAGDIDIVIRKKDIIQTRDLLLSEGYRPKLIAKKHQEKILLKRYKDYGFTHPIHKHTVEIHWSLIPSYFKSDFGLDYFDRRQQIIEINQQSLSTFDLEDMFLALACHGALHRFESLKWLIDLHQFATLYPNIDWCALARRAQDEGVETTFLLGIDLCRSVMGTEFSAYNETHPQRIRIAAMSKMVCEVISTGHDPKNPFEQFVFYVRLIDGFWRKLRYIFMRTFDLGVEDTAATNLPWFLTPFYYLMRAARLIHQRGVGTLLRTFGRMVQAMRR